MIQSDREYMKMALKQAERAAKLGEVPIGCVIVYTGPGEWKAPENRITNTEGGEPGVCEGEMVFVPRPEGNLSKGDRILLERAASAGIQPGMVIGRGYNRRNTDHSTLSHAELTAMRRATKKLGDWRLEGCTMYVTLEPCMMCSGACVQSRIDRVVMGARNPKAGCAGSILNLLDEPRFNHRVRITDDVLGDVCGQLLKKFFGGFR